MELKPISCDGRPILVNLPWPDCWYKTWCPKSIEIVFTDQSCCYKSMSHMEAGKIKQHCANSVAFQGGKKFLNASQGNLPLDFGSNTVHRSLHCWGRNVIILVGSFIRIKKVLVTIKPFRPRLFNLVLQCKQLRSRLWAEILFRSQPRAEQIQVVQSRMTMASSKVWSECNVPNCPKRSWGTYFRHLFNYSGSGKEPTLNSLK